MRSGKELNLEDYVRFFNKEELSLNWNQLRKIASINGLIKLRPFNKSSVLDALRTADLTPPGRSTIGESLLRSSTNAKLSQDEAMKDIASLGWQECPIVSILTFGNEWVIGAAEKSALISSSSDQTKKKGGKGGESKCSGFKRKKKYVAALADLPLLGQVERTTVNPSGSQVWNK